MKKIITFLIGMVTIVVGWGQSDTIKLKDLIVPTSPAFNLIDISPKTVEKPGTVKALAFGVVNTIDQNTGIPKNFAFEFAPFWLVQHRSMSFFKYNGIKLDPSRGDLFKQNPFYGIRNLSFSIASIAKDSLKTSPFKVNYLSYGVKANLFNIRKKRVTDSLAAAGVALNGEIIDILKNNVCDSLDPDSEDFRKCFNKRLFAQNTTVAKKRGYIDTLLTIRPVFSLDVAFASSTAFANSQVNNNHHYRTGGWVNFSYSQPLIGKSSKNLAGFYKAKNYINIYGFGRILNQDTTVDFKTFANQTFTDLGGRLEFEFDEFAISFESIHRNVKDKSDLNSFRNVGILQYRISDNFYLLGTFGKNFGSVNNLVAFLGINFGFGKSALSTRFQ